MQTLDLDRQTYLRVLAYGKPGAGKTHFVGSASLDPRTAPALHVDVSGNPETLRKQRERPHVLRLETLDDLNHIYDWFYRRQPATHVLCSKFGLKPGYKTLIFDGITAIQRKSFELVMNTGNVQPGSVQPKAEWSHYRSVLAQMLKIAQCFFQTLPSTHVLVTALEHTDQRLQTPGDQTSAYAYAEVALQGQSGDELPGEALAVMRLTAAAATDPAVLNPLLPKDKNIPRPVSIGQLLPSRTVYAKDQHGFGMAYMPDPTVTKMLDIIEGR